MVLPLAMVMLAVMSAPSLMVVTLLPFKACSNSSFLLTVASPSAAQLTLHSPSAMTSAKMVANIFFIFLTPGFLDFRRVLRFNKLKTPKQEYSCG